MNRMGQMGRRFVRFLPNSRAFVGIGVALVAANTTMAQAVRPAGAEQVLPATSVAPTEASRHQTAGLAEYLIADPVGKCSGGAHTLCDVPAQDCPVGQTCEPWTINRFISFSVAPALAGQDAALRVRLTSLYHPGAPLPNLGSPPNLSVFEGQYRYVNLLPSAPKRCCTDGLLCNTSVTCGSDTDCMGVVVSTSNPPNPTAAPFCTPNLCLDSPAFKSHYPCAKLGCTPEYHDWDAEFGGNLVYVYGDAVVPDSLYEVAVLDASCAGMENTCAPASSELSVRTARWGNLDGVGVFPSAIDIGFSTAGAKDAPGGLGEARCIMNGSPPNPFGSSISAVDCGRSVDSVKGGWYPSALNIANCN